MIKHIATKFSLKQLNIKSWWNKWKQTIEQNPVNVSEIYTKAIHNLFVNAFQSFSVTNFRKKNYSRICLEFLSKFWANPLQSIHTNELNVMKLTASAAYFNILCLFLIFAIWIFEKNKENITNILKSFFILVLNVFFFLYIFLHDMI